MAGLPLSPASIPPRRYRAYRWWLAALLIGGAVPADARRVTAERAPVEWVAYAAAANVRFKSWLAGSDADAIRLRTLLATQQAADGTPRIIQLWINRRGVVTRVRFMPDAPADMADLTRSFVGQIMARPPRRMPQPLRFAVDAKIQQ